MGIINSLGISCELNQFLLEFHDNSLLLVQNRSSEWKPNLHAQIKALRNISP